MHIVICFKKNLLQNTMTKKTKLMPVQVIILMSHYITSFWAVFAKIHPDMCESKCYIMCKQYKEKFDGEMTC